MRFITRHAGSGIAALALTALLPLAAAAQGDTYRGPPLPRPDRILVYDFATSPEQVQLDKGLGSRLTRALRNSKPDAKQAETAQEVMNAIATTLTAQLQALGIPAVRATGATTVAQGEKVLVVRGQVESIDEGNRTRRRIIGLGAGRSQVEAASQLYYQAPAASALQFLERTESKADSGRMPGMAAGMGVGAAAGAAAGAATTGARALNEQTRSPVAAEGERIGKQLARNYALYFAKQGWIPASAVPPASLR
jgi:hypothetical protein